jgi:hypothetical protein
MGMGLRSDTLGPLLALWRRLNQTNGSLLQQATVADQRGDRRPLSAAATAGGKAQPKDEEEVEKTTDPIAEVLELEYAFALRLVNFWEKMKNHFKIRLIRNNSY